MLAFELISVEAALYFNFPGAGFTAVGGDLDKLTNNFEGQFSD